MRMFPLPQLRLQDLIAGEPNFELYCFHYHSAAKQLALEHVWRWPEHLIAGGGGSS